MSKLSKAYTHYATARMLHRRISRIHKRVWQDADIREASLQRALRARREYYSLLASLGAYEVARWRWRQAREYRAAVNSEHNRRERAARLAYRLRVAIVEREWQYMPFAVECHPLDWSRPYNEWPITCKHPLGADADKACPTHG